ncbi:MAG: SH3 domain-containing protein [Anaerolineae bacterium]|jgi:hypothetical protein
MSRDPGSFGGQGVNIWLIAGWAILVLFAIGIIVAGLLLFREEKARPEATQAPTATSAPLVPPTSMLAPTSTPLPTATSLPTVASVLPTAVPPTAVPSAMIEAGEAGVNVRSGPGTGFGVVGRLEPGQEAAVTGRYEDWWQIDYGGTPGWVADWVVTAYDTDSVAEVVPPPSPIPATSAPLPTATSVPPTVAAVECGGIVADDFQVEGAPGPYAVGAPIWFSLWITNKTGDKVEYRSLGVDALKDGVSVKYQQSYSYSFVDAYKQFTHRDRIILDSAGTYDLWLTLGLTETEWCRLMGPIQVVVQ